MRYLRIVALVFVLVLVDARVFATPVDDSRRMLDYLSTHPQSSLVGTTWKSMTEFQKTFFLNGVMKGSSVGDIIVREFEPLSTQRLRMYLLSGWRMPSSVYVSEVSVILTEKAGKKSICTSFIKAEAQFAAKAGQDERAAMLLRSVGDFENIQRLISPLAKNDVISQNNDCAGLWHDLECTKSTDIFTQGFLQGIRLSSARVTLGLRASDLSFRVGQLSKEVDALVIKEETDPYEDLLTLLVRANTNLLKQAVGQ